MSRRRVYNWILEVTRPALKPLALSVSARLLDQILQVVIYSLGAYALAVALRKLSGGGGLDTGLVWLFLLACLIIALVKAALRYAEQFMGHLVAFKALELLRIALFKSMLPQSPRLSLHTRSAELTGRLTKDICPHFGAASKFPGSAAADLGVDRLCVSGYGFYFRPGDAGADLSGGAVDGG